MVIVIIIESGVARKVKENMKLNIVLSETSLFAHFWLSQLPPSRPLIKRRNFECILHFTSIAETIIITITITTILIVITIMILIMI